MLDRRPRRSRPPFAGRRPDRSRPTVIDVRSRVARPVMRVVIAGAHGQVARRLGRLLSAPRRHRRRHRPQPRPRGGPARPTASSRSCWTSSALRSTRSPRSCVGADAVVFAAGAGPGSGDRPQAHRRPRRPPCCSPTPRSRPAVRPYLLVSSMGVEQVAGGATPEGVDDGLRRLPAAKLARRGRHPAAGRGWTRRCCGPARLTDDPGTGRVTLGHGVEPRRRSPGTTSPPSSLACWTPGATATCSSWSAGRRRSPRRSRRCR